MQVTVLGSGTGCPTKERGSAAIHVEVGGQHLLLDAGPGSLRQLARLGASHLRLDRVYLTHLHPDHCLDLFAILFAMRHPYPPRRKPLVLAGPPGLARLYASVNRAFHRWFEPQTYRLILKELTERSVERLPGAQLTVRRMRHSAPAFGYRLESRNGTLAYSGDTDVCDAVVELGRHADLLILECSTPDARKVAGHLTPSECGRIAAASGCRRLVLVHLNPIFQGQDIRPPIRRYFNGPLTIARDGQPFRLRRRR